MLDPQTTFGIGLDADMELVRDIPTRALRRGDTVALSGSVWSVEGAKPTGRPAVFGVGSEWLVALAADSGIRKEIASAESHVWKHVGTRALNDG